jgi:hypothetical protein
VGLLGLLVVLVIATARWQPVGVVRDKLNEASTWLSLNTDLVAQIVPAIVVAIFVFAVGTAFVVAQVVPPARGTRAVAVLQGRRLIGTISPTLALLLGSAYVVTGSLPNTVLPGEREAAAVVLVGALFYTGYALVALTSVLVDATDPAQFKHFLLKKARRATRRLVKAVRSGDDSTDSKRQRGCPKHPEGESERAAEWEEWFARIQARSMMEQPLVVRKQGTKTNFRTSSVRRGNG